MTTPAVSVVVSVSKQSAVVDSVALPAALARSVLVLFEILFVWP